MEGAVLYYSTNANNEPSQLSKEIRFSPQAWLRFRMHYSITHTDIDATINALMHAEASDFLTGKFS